MGNRSRNTMIEKILSGNGPVSARSLALILMVLGAAGFMISLVVFGEQILCLVGSTLVVFTGLAVVVTARKFHGDVEDVAELEPPHHRAKTYPVPDRRSLNAQQPLPAQSPAPARWSSGPSGQDEPEPQDRFIQKNESSDLAEPHLIDRVSRVLRHQGATVKLDALREARGLLNVISQNGRQYCMMINEAPDEIQVSDLRALSAVWSNSPADKAVFISASPFTQQAVDWANARSILLVVDEQIENLVLS